MEDFHAETAPRRSPRRVALAPLINTTILDTPENGRTTPLSPEEFIIEQRGRRRPPITWSPVEYSKTDILGPPRDRTPERVPQRPEISVKLRRRLTMSSVEEPTFQLGNNIAKKLKAISNTSENRNDEQK